MRILGITIPEEKRLDIGLTVLFGIGRPMATKILKDAKIKEDARPQDLNIEDENRVRAIVEAMVVEGDLKREVAGNIKRLKDIKAYRGVRHMRGLPVHGQRTKSNSRTRRGNVRKTMGTGRKIAEKK
jgi:small subunit ribosomal protein S13